MSRPNDASIAEGLLKDFREILFIRDDLFNIPDRTGSVDINNAQGSLLDAALDIGKALKANEVTSEWYQNLQKSINTVGKNTVILSSIDDFLKDL